MGRPRKYFSVEARVEARRLQTRANLKAFRARQRADRTNSTADDESYLGDGDSSSGGKNALALCTSNTSSVSRSIDGRRGSRLRSLHSPSPEADMLNHSCLPPIDLSFGFLESIVHEYHSTANKCVPWNLLLEPHTANDMLRVAVAGVAFEFMGRKYNDQVMLTKGFAAYHEALQYLQGRLCYAEGVERDAVWLYSICVALFWIDVTESAVGAQKGLPDHLEWVNHWRAASKILQQAGPSAFDSQLGRLVLRKTWFSLVFLAMIDKQTVFVSNTSWRSLYPEDNQLADLFCFFGIKLPGFMRRADDVSSGASGTKGADNIREAQELLDDLMAHKKNLEQWLDVFSKQEENVKGADRLLTRLSEEPSTDLSLQRLADLDIGRRSVMEEVSIAELMLAYWFCRLQLSMAILQTQKHIAKSSRRKSKTQATCTELEDGCAIARHIVNLSHSLVSQYLTSFAVIMFSVSAPIRVAIQFFYQHEPPGYEEDLCQSFAFLKRYAAADKAGAMAGYAVDTLFGHVQEFWIRKVAAEMFARKSETPT